ncbi:histidine phosphatase superfamily [Biscogniauxia mediterranea]|nr:histidine phosphatase superfamily [Biscogniauxia mediterranea]
MPPTLVLVRHAQALHNATHDYSIHDPGLSEIGREQCVPLRRALMEDPIAQKAELIITSPMRRTIQTALASVDWLLEKGVRIQADAGWQENSDKPCDTGSPVDKVAAEFPAVDFSTLDPAWPDKTSPAGSHYHYTKTALLVRAQASLKKLYERPEKVILVVSHSAFMRLAVTGCWYFNADYRIFDFAEMAGPGDTYRLEQHASTKEKGGGLGLSWTEPVVLGSGLPEELPEAEA